MFLGQNIYRYILLLGVSREGKMVHLTFFVYYSEKQKKYKSMTDTKIEFYIILILKIFPRLNNFLEKWGPSGPTPISL